jgi:serpin B
LALVSGCSARATNGGPNAEPSHQPTLTYATALSTAIESEKHKPNLLASPLGLQQLLAMLALGANGQTKDQIAGVLSQNGVSPDQTIADVADTARALTAASPKTLVLKNSFWVDTRYHPTAAFEHSLRDTFSAPLFRAKFPEVIPRIERWVADATGGHISRIPIPDIAVFVGLNAMSYRGSWATPFERKQTRLSDFHAADKTYSVQMMNASRSEKYFQDAQDQYVMLPFSDGREMIVALPKDASSPPSAARALDALKKRELFSFEYVSVSLPRFTFHCHVDLVPVLQHLGMVDAFASRADFRGIFGAPHVKVNILYQEGEITVNERGAQTSVVSVVIRTLGLSRSVPFNANHPFAFAIDDPKSGAVIAAGTVDQP